MENFILWFTTNKNKLINNFGTQQILNPGLHVSQLCNFIPQVSSSVSHLDVDLSYKQAEAVVLDMMHFLDPTFFYLVSDMIA